MHRCVFEHVREYFLQESRRAEPEKLQFLVLLRRFGSVLCAGGTELFDSVTSALFWVLPATMILTTFRVEIIMSQFGHEL